jgi:hypothetical protein
MLNWKSVRVGHILLLAGFAVMSLSMARNIPLFAVVSVPILSELAARTLSGPNTWTKVEERFAGFSLGSGRSVFWPVVVTLLAIISIAYSNIKNGRNIYQFNPETFPVQAVEFLERNPQEGNMFNEFNWGGYLLYRSWPEHLVFIDSQSDFYGEELMREYDQVMSASGDWQDVLNKYDVTWVIIPAGSPLAQEIINEPGWTIIYEDNTSGIGVRK